MALPPMVVLVVAAVVSRCSEQVPDFWEAFRRQKRPDGEKIVRCQVCNCVVLINDLVLLWERRIAGVKCPTCKRGDI